MVNALLHQTVLLDACGGMGFVAKAFKPQAAVHQMWQTPTTRKLNVSTGKLKVDYPLAH